MEEIQGGVVSKNHTNMSARVGSETAKVWDVGGVKLVGRTGGGRGLSAVQGKRQEKCYKVNTLPFSIQYTTPSNMQFGALLFGCR